MTISELIKVLEEIKEKEGDLKVVIYDDRTFDYHDIELTVRDIAGETLVEVV